MDELGADPDPTIDPPSGGPGGSLPPGLGVRPGDTIGPFRIMQVLGEGGFGVVYLAEQTSPVKRRVALKVIKPGMDTRAVIARFEAERQALAMMDSPGIAKVFEAGSTDEGRPYFVMEYVKGEPITDYCDRHTLDTRSRLELFAKVCDAIQHAHQKGVIHRDIKPGNILVTIDSRDQPQPKVIDFGIAKATAQSLTEKTIFTEQGQLIGTPEYMSPEQAEMSAVDIDTRSDVYALGVVLYELISGQLPFDRKTLRKAGYAEIQRIIREEEPPRPSTKLTTRVGEEGTRIADARRTKISELQSTLRKELEWIPLKALRKERTERYGSAEDLAEDVRRYLVGEPLEAGPESAGYRFKKLVRRNKGPFIAAALIGLALIAGIIGTTIFAVRAAEQARIAEQRAEELQQVADFQSEQLAGIDVAEMGGSLRDRMLEELELEPSDVAGADFTGAALGLLNEHVFAGTQSTINEQFADQPLVRAQLLHSLAHVLYELGMLDDAESPQNAALRLRREHHGDKHPDTLHSASAMGLLLMNQGRYDESHVLLEECVNSFRSVQGDEHSDTLMAINNMGLLLIRQNRHDEAMQYFKEANEVFRRTIGAEHKRTLASTYNIGYLLFSMGEYQDAVPYYRDALDGFQATLGAEHPMSIASVVGMGKLLRKQGKYDEAQPLLVKGMQLSRKILGDEHPETLISMKYLGELLVAQGKYEEAKPYLTEVLESTRRTRGSDHLHTISAMNSLGNLFMAQKAFAEACELYNSVFEGRRRILGPEHPHTASAMANLGNAHAMQGDYDSALECYGQALAVQRSISGEDDLNTLLIRNNMGEVLGMKGRYDEAIPYITETLSVRRQKLGDQHPDTLGSLHVMASLLKGQKRYDEALTFFQDCLQSRREVLGDAHPHTLKTINSLIDLHEAWHEAEPGAGHDAKAAEYRALLAEPAASDAPAVP